MYDPIIHRRRSIRIPEYDYARPGYYFVTICVKERIHSFGNIMNKRMSYNREGYLAKREIRNIKKHFKRIRIDSFIVMPDHIHAIIQIKFPYHTHHPTGFIAPTVGARFIAPQAETAPHQINTPVVGARFIAPQAETAPHQINTPVVGARFIAPRSAFGPHQFNAPQNPGATHNDRGDKHNDRGAMNRAPTVGEIVRIYKARCAFFIRRSIDPYFQWQRNYYESIIRNADGLSAVREYIRLNPQR